MFAVLIVAGALAAGGAAGEGKAGVAATTYEGKGSVAATTYDLTHPAPPLRVAELDAAQNAKIRFDVNKAALIIVDMQNYFVKSPSAPGRNLISAQNAVAAAFRAANATVLWVNWDVRADYEDWPGRSAMGAHDWYPPVKGTHDAELFPGLHTAPSDLFVDKYRETGFYRSELDDILRFRGIRTLFLGGVNTDQCVASTMYDAARLGYDTVLMSDLTATTSPHYAYEATVFNSHGPPQAIALLRRSSICKKR